MVRRLANAMFECQCVNAPCSVAGKHFTGKAMGHVARHESAVRKRQERDRLEILQWKQLTQPRQGYLPEEKSKQEGGPSHGPGLEFDDMNLDLQVQCHEEDEHQKNKKQHHDKLIFPDPTDPTVEDPLYEIYTKIAAENSNHLCHDEGSGSKEQQPSRVEIFQTLLAHFIVTSNNGQGMSKKDSNELFKLLNYARKFPGDLAKLEIDSTYQLDKHLLYGIAGDGWNMKNLANEVQDGDQELWLYYRNPIEVITSILSKKSEENGEVFYHYTPIYASEYGKKVQVYLHPFNCEFVHDCEKYLRKNCDGYESRNPTGDHPFNHNMHNNRPRRVPVLCQLASDETKVTNKGTVRGYPLYIFPENLSLEEKTRDVEKFLVALLPTYKQQPNQSNRKFKERKSLLFQYALHLITKPLKDVGLRGHLFVDERNKVVRLLHFFLSSYVMDFIEAKEVFNTKSSNKSKRGCPSCFVRSSLFSTAVVWPHEADPNKRTFGDFQLKYRQSSNMNQGEKEELEKENGQFYTASLGLAGFLAQDEPWGDLYRCYTYDSLHNDDLGIWKMLCEIGVTWVKVTQGEKANSVLKGINLKIDLIRSCSRIVIVRLPKEKKKSGNVTGYFGGSANIEAVEHVAVSQILVFAVDGILPDELVKCYSLYLEWYIMKHCKNRNPGHTMKTLQAAHDKLVQLTSTLHNFQDSLIRELKEKEDAAREARSKRAAGQDQSKAGGRASANHTDVVSDSDSDVPRLSGSNGRSRPRGFENNRSRTGELQSSQFATPKLHLALCHSNECIINHGLLEYQSAMLTEMAHKPLKQMYKGTSKRDAKGETRMLGTETVNKVRVRESMNEKLEKVGLSALAGWEYTEEGDILPMSSNQRVYNTAKRKLLQINRTDVVSGVPQQKYVLPLRVFRQILCTRDNDPCHENFPWGTNNRNRMALSQKTKDLFIKFFKDVPHFKEFLPTLHKVIETAWNSRRRNIPRDISPEELCRKLVDEQEVKISIFTSAIIRSNFPTTLEFQDVERNRGMVLGVGKPYLEAGSYFQKLHCDGRVIKCSGFDRKVLLHDNVMLMNEEDVQAPFYLARVLMLFQLDLSSLDDDPGVVDGCDPMSTYAYIHYYNISSVSDTTGTDVYKLSYHTGERTGKPWCNIVPLNSICRRVHMVRNVWDSEPSRSDRNEDDDKYYHNKYYLIHTKDKCLDMTSLQVPEESG